MENAVISNKARTRTFLACMILFFAFSFIGWCMEKTSFLIAYGVNADRGFLRLPFCTVYGSGLLLVRAVLGAPVYDKSRYPVNLVGLILYALLAALIATCVELLTGVLFGEVFHQPLWSYRGYSFTLTDYVCLPMSFAWGALASVVMPAVWVPLEHKIARLPLAMLWTAVFVFSLLLLTDFIILMIGIL